MRWRRNGTGDKKGAKGRVYDQVIFGNWLVRKQNFPECVAIPAPRGSKPVGEYTARHDAPHHDARGRKLCFLFLPAIAKNPLRRHLIPYAPTPYTPKA